MSNITYKYVTWQDVENDCLSIHAHMKRDNYVPEVVIGLLRGGVVPARIFMDFYHVSLDFCALDVKLYDGIASKRKKPVIKDFMGSKINGKKVLIVDDIYDSGETMKAVLEYLKPRNVKITTATLYLKEGRDQECDVNYYSKIAKKDEWIVFPWERYEFWGLLNEKK